MVKKDVVSMVSKHSGVNKKTVCSVLDALADVISDSLESGEKVQFSGFGTFDIKECAERTGRNIKRDETVVIPKG